MIWKTTIIPQIIMILVMAETLIMNTIHHGEMRNEKYDIRIAIVSVIFEASILTWGGFWS